MASGFKAWLSQKLEREAPRQSGYQAFAQPKATAEPYHAVSVRPGHPCCEAARQFGQLRFLSRKAPRLPLPACDVAVCTCRYSHYSDRRTGLDRRAVLDRQREQTLNAVNRRQNNGRRSTDAVG
jgi:hypothetical protein